MLLALNLIAVLYIVPHIYLIRLIIIAVIIRIATYEQY